MTSQNQIDPDPKSILRQRARRAGRGRRQRRYHRRADPRRRQATARVITREDGVLCGRAWVDAGIHELDPRVTCTGRPMTASHQRRRSVVHRQWTGAQPVDRGALRPELPATAVRHGHHMPALRRHGAGHRGAACWTPARPFPACVSRRNTLCAAAAATTTASACLTLS